MNKLLVLVVVSSIGLLNADIKEIPQSPWSQSGLYQKYGIGSSWVLPTCPTAGIGYFADPFDLSVSGSIGILRQSCDCKVYYLPITKQNFHIGLGPSYTYDRFETNAIKKSHIFGGSLLYRYIYSGSKCFQVEITQPIVFTVSKQDCMPRNSERYIPGIYLTWGKKF